MKETKEIHSDETDRDMLILYPNPGLQVNCNQVLLTAGHNLKVVEISSPLAQDDLSGGRSRISICTDGKNYDA